MFSRTNDLKTSDDSIPSKCTTNRVGCFTIESTGEKPKEKYCLSSTSQQEHSKVLISVLPESASTGTDAAILNELVSFEGKHFFQPIFSLQRGETGFFGLGISQDTTEVKKNNSYELSEHSGCDKDIEINSDSLNKWCYPQYIKRNELELKAAALPNIYFDNENMSKYTESAKLKEAFYANHYYSSQDHISVLNMNTNNYTGNLKNFSHTNLKASQKLSLNFEVSPKTNPEYTFLLNNFKGNNSLENSTNSYSNSTIKEVLQFMSHNKPLRLEDLTRECLDHEYIMNHCISLSVGRFSENTDKLITLKNYTDNYTTQHIKTAFSTHLKSLICQNNREAFKKSELPMPHIKVSSDILKNNLKNCSIKFETNFQVKLNFCAKFDPHITDSYNNSCTYIIDNHQQDITSVLLKSGIEHLFTPEFLAQNRTKDIQTIVQCGRNNQLVPWPRRESTINHHTSVQMNESPDKEVFSNRYIRNQVLDECNRTSPNFCIKNNDEENNVIIEEHAETECQGKKTIRYEPTSVNFNDKNYEISKEEINSVTLHDLIVSPKVTSINSRHLLSDKQTQCNSRGMNTHSYLTSCYISTVYPDEVNRELKMDILFENDQRKEVSETTYRKLDILPCMGNISDIDKGTLKNDFEIESVDSQKTDIEIANEKEEIGNEQASFDIDALEKSINTQSENGGFGDVADIGDVEMIDDIDRAIEVAINKYEDLPSRPTADKSCQTDPYQQESRVLCKRCLRFEDDLEPPKKVKITCKRDSEVDFLSCNSAFICSSRLNVNNTNDNKENNLMQVWEESEFDRFEDSKSMDFNDDSSQSSILAEKSASALLLGDIYKGLKSRQGNYELSLYEKQRIDLNITNKKCEESGNTPCNDQVFPSFQEDKNTQTSLDSFPNPTPPKLRIGLSRSARLKPLHPKARLMHAAEQ